MILQGKAVEPECYHKITKLQFHHQCSKKAGLCEKDCQKTSQHSDLKQHRQIELNTFELIYQQIKRSALKQVEKHKARIGTIYEVLLRQINAKKKKYQAMIQDQLYAIIRSPVQGSKLTDASIGKFQNKRWDNIRCFEINEILKISQNQYFQINHSKLKQIVENYSMESGAFQIRSQNPTSVQGESKQKLKLSKTSQKSLEDSDIQTLRQKIIFQSDLIGKLKEKNSFLQNQLQEKAKQLADALRLNKQLNNANKTKNADKFRVEKLYTAKIIPRKVQQIGNSSAQPRSILQGNGKEIQNQIVHSVSNINIIAKSLKDTNPSEVKISTSPIKRNEISLMQQKFMVPKKSSLEGHTNALTKTSSFQIPQISSQSNQNTAFEQLLKEQYQTKKNQQRLEQKKQNRRLTQMTFSQKNDQGCLNHHNDSTNQADQVNLNRPNFSKQMVHKPQNFQSGTTQEPPKQRQENKSSVPADPKNGKSIFSWLPNSWRDEFSDRG